MTNPEFPDHVRKNIPLPEQRRYKEGPSSLGLAIARRDQGEIGLFYERLRIRSGFTLQPQFSPLDAYVDRTSALAVDQFMPESEDTLSATPIPDYQEFSITRMGMIGPPEEIIDEAAEQYPDPFLRMLTRFNIDPIDAHVRMQTHFAMLDALRPPYGNMTHLLAMRPVAAAMAIRRGIPLEDMYELDDQFSDLVKATFGTVETYADRALADVDERTTDEISRLQALVYLPTTEGPQVAFVDPVLAERNGRILLDTTVGDRIIEIWGFEEYLNLPPEILTRLGNRPSST